MKRFTGILAAATIAFAPMSASALEALTDNAMNDVRAQAGVSIALDDIVIYQTGIADTTYTDKDGMTNLLDADKHTGNVTSAGVKISYNDVIQKLTIIDGITDATKYGIANMQAAFGAGIGMVGMVNGADAIGAGTWAAVMDPTTGNISSAVPGADYATGASPLTIDIGTCESLTAGFANNQGGTSTLGDIAGVIIGLPTIEIKSYHTEDTKTISLVADATQAANADKAFIEITKSGSSTMAILGGRIEIAPH